MKSSKIFFYISTLVAGVIISSCTKELGTEPGSETAPKVTFYKYAAPAEYNQDESLTLRIVPNGKVSDMYFLYEPKVDKESFIEEKGADAYIDKVISEGEKYEGVDKDLVLSNLQGLFAITVVAENEKGVRLAYETTFKGIKWVDGGTAVFYDATFTGKMASVNVLRQDDVNAFKVVDPCGQVEISAPNPSNIITFSQEKGEDVTEFDVPNKLLPVSVAGYYFYYDPSSYADYCDFETDYSNPAPALFVTTLKANSQGQVFTGGLFALLLNGLKYVGEE